MTRRHRIEALVVRIQRDFLDMPRLRLTAKDASKRFNLDETTCEAILQVLVDARVLARTRDRACFRYVPRAVSREAINPPRRSRAYGRAGWRHNTLTEHAA
jgi:hypothetical protein